MASSSTGSGNVQEKLGVFFSAHNLGSVHFHAHIHAHTMMGVCWLDIGALQNNLEAS